MVNLPVIVNEVKALLVIQYFQNKIRPYDYSQVVSSSRVCYLLRPVAAVKIAVFAITKVKLMILSA